MPPTLILIRHAQAEHNLKKAYGIHDPDLTDQGREQCAVLRKGLLDDPLVQKAEIIITSPMRRTIQTALASVDWLVERGIKLVADAGWQENSAKPCDSGSAVSRLIEEYPSVDYSTLDPVWPDKTTPAGSKYHYTKTALLARAQESLKKLYERPEKVIIVVSHSAFLRHAVTGCWFFNGDYRVFDFAARAGPGDTYRLEQHASTAGKGGGLGLSYTEELLIGSNLPDEIPEAE